MILAFFYCNSYGILVAHCVLDLTVRCIWCLYSCCSCSDYRMLMLIEVTRCSTFDDGRQCKLTVDIQQRATLDIPCCLYISESEKT